MRYYKKKRKKHKYSRATRKAMKILFTMATLETSRVISNYSLVLYKRHDAHIAWHFRILAAIVMGGFISIAFISNTIGEIYRMPIVGFMWIVLVASIIVWCKRDMRITHRYNKIANDLHTKIKALYAQIPSQLIMDT